MLILPAIDLLEGKCVRLAQGDYRQVREYSHDPISVARKFLEDGATFLHVVDLEGAREGIPVNHRSIFGIGGAVDIPLQVGGGIRTCEDASLFLNGGIRRVIFGTSAIEDPAMIEMALDTFGQSRIVVSIDVIEGQIASRGWQQRSEASLNEVGSLLKALGVGRIVVTDIRSDGMLRGPNWALIDRILGLGFKTVIAGGVSTLTDLKKLKALGVEGVIIGKALYEGKVDLKEAISVGRERSDLAKRIIPCLDIRGGRVVKGTHFTDLRDAGDPVRLGKRYSDLGADEIVFLDITAAVENRGTLFDLVARVAEELTIPFTVGGGIRSIDDIRRLLRSGADKVSIGSAAATDPALVWRASQEFGSQCIVISVDAKKSRRGWNICIRDGTQATEKDAVAFSKEMEALGAGELLVNSLDRDGTRKGFDINLLREISEAVNIPVVASSGAGILADFLEVLRQTEVDAVLAASVFHYGEIEIRELKRYLKENRIQVRL